MVVLALLGRRRRDVVSFWEVEASAETVSAADTAGSVAVFSQVTVKSS